MRLSNPFAFSPSFSNPSHPFPSLFFFSYLRIMSSIYTSYLSLSTPPRSSLSLALLFLELTILALAHAAISVFWVVGMKRLGAPTTTYASFLVALGGFIWGLGCWRGLV